MKQYPEILDALYEVLQPFVGEKDVVLSEDTALVGDLEIDSVKLLELMMEIEDRFDISVPINVLPDITTVKDLALKLEELLN